MPKTLRLNKDWLRATHIPVVPVGNLSPHILEKARIVDTYKDEIKTRNVKTIIHWWAAECLEFERVMAYYLKEAKKYRIRYDRYVKKNRKITRRKKRGKT